MDQGFTLWFTGLSGAGKSTLANLAADELRKRAHRVEILDGDEVRTNLSKGLGFSKEDRDINIRRIGYVCNLLARNGVIAISAAISPTATCATNALMVAAYLIANFAVRRNRRGNRDDTVARQQIADVADAPDVDVAILFGKAEALGKIGANFVAVEDFDAVPAIAQLGRGEVGKRRFPSPG